MKYNLTIENSTACDYYVTIYFKNEIGQDDTISDYYVSTSIDNLIDTIKSEYKDVSCIEIYEYKGDYRLR